jgi:prepilin-type N-terminal cleavage/methylation domain-containing protein
MERRAGFTLLEVLIALGILAVIASLGFGLAISDARKEKAALEAAAADLAQTLRRARTDAIIEARTIGVAFGPPSDVVPNQAAPATKRYSPPTGICIHITRAGRSVETATASFASDGSAAPLRITLVRGEAQRSVEVIWPLGAVRVF